MRLTLSLFLLIAGMIATLNSSAQIEGCTNIEAINFDPQAEIDNGSCEVFSTSIAYDAQFTDDIEIGTGISNEHAAIATHGPLEFGLKVNRRYVEDIIPEDDFNYYVETGFGQTSFFDPTPVPGIAWWDFIFSFNLGDYTFNDLTAVVFVDFDPIDNENQVDPYPFDQSLVAISLDEGNTSFRQGSENLGFNFWPFIAGVDAYLFDPLSPGVYDFKVQVRNKADFVLGEVSIRVIAGDPVDGCTDPEACNYDENANVNDTTCEYPELYKDCDGNCIHDFNNNQVCDEEEIYGCTYETAANFNPEATADDGTCLLECEELSDCERIDFNNDGIVNSSDLLVFLSLYGLVCDEID